MMIVGFIIMRLPAADQDDVLSELVHPPHHCAFDCQVD